MYIKCITRCRTHLSTFKKPTNATCAALDNLLGLLNVFLTTGQRVPLSHKVPTHRTYQTSSLGLPLTLLTALRGTSVSTLVVPTLIFIPLRLRTRREGDDCAATSQHVCRESRARVFVDLSARRFFFCRRVHATGSAWLRLCAWRFVSVSAPWVSRLAVYCDKTSSS